VAFCSGEPGLCALFWLPETSMISVRSMSDSSCLMSPNQEVWDVGVGAALVDVRDMKPRWSFLT